MICPKCGSQTRVVDSRSVDGGVTTRRRHDCVRCKYRFTTYEISERQLALFERAERIKNKLVNKIGELEKVMEG